MVYCARRRFRRHRQMVLFSMPEAISNMNMMCEESLSLSLQSLLENNLSLRIYGAASHAAERAGLSFKPVSRS